MSECNKSFSDIISEVYDEQIGELLSYKGQLQLVLAGAFSAMPLLHPIANFSDDAAKEVLEQIWGGFGAGVNSAVDAATSPITPTTFASQFRGHHNFGDQFRAIPGTLY